MRWSRSPIVWILTAAVIVTLTSRAAGQEGYAHAISLTDGADFSDLAFLAEVLKDKRLVLLGESNHGSREFNLQKNRLIRFLHEELGFGVLLLESGMGEVYAIDYRRGELSEGRMLSAGLVGPWRTLEYAELMKYLKQTPDLRVGGYDVQRSGRTFGWTLADVRVALGSEEAAGFEDLEDRFSDSLGKLKDKKREADDALTMEIARLKEGYEAAHRRIADDTPKLLEHGWTGTQLALVLQTIRNRLTFLDYYMNFKLDRDYRTRWTARDTAMADNVIFFAKELFPDEKIIVSGHNFHIARFNEKEHVMGEILADTFGSSVYAVALFAGEGSYLNNYRKPQVLDAPTEANDIRHVIRRLGKPSVFINIPAKPLAGTEWLFTEAFLDHTFLDLDGGKTLNLSKAFDGLVLISQTTPAQFPDD